MDRIGNAAAVFAFVLGTHAVTVGAVQLGNPPATGAARQPSKMVNPQPVARSNSLRAGVVTAIDSAGRKVEIQGQWYGIVVGQTQIFQQGKSARADALQKGQAIKFAIADGDASGTRLGVVYVP